MGKNGIGSNKQRYEENSASFGKKGTINRHIPDDEWDQYPLPEADNIPPMAFDGIPQHQHELHCAMALYHLATLGLPMTLSPRPKRFPSE